MDTSKVYTNDLGEYIIETRNSISKQLYTLKFRDIDEGLNGAYKDIDTIIDFTNIEYVGGDGSWNYGDKALRLDIELESL